MPTSSTSRPSRLIGIFFIGLGLLSLAPFPILGPALGWPATLGDPASVMLPKVLAHPQAVQFGYGLYLLYSLAFAAIPVCLLSLARLPVSAVAIAAIAFGATSSAMRAVGIVRWLSPIPELAQRYPGADPLLVTAITVQYETVNLWGGSIGEILGVGVFAGLALGCTALATWRAPNIPRWISASAFAVGVLQLSSLGTVIGITGASVMITSTACNLWLLCAGFGLLVISFLSPTMTKSKS